MSCENNQRHEDECCIGEVLSLIVKLQDCSENCELINGGCDKPFLGPTPSLVCFNTRPVQLFRCLDGEAWTLPYTFNGTTGTSDIFRIEGVDGCCATGRILIPNPDTTIPTSPYVATDSFFTINLNCVGALRCLTDVVVQNL